MAKDRALLGDPEFGKSSATPDTEESVRREAEESTDEGVSRESTRKALRRDGPPMRRFGQDRPMVALSVAAAVGIAAFLLVIATGAALLAVIGLAVVVVGVLAMAAMTFRMTEDPEKPAPEAVARLENEGVDDPEETLNRAVDEEESRR